MSSTAGRRYEALKHIHERVTDAAPEDRDALLEELTAGDAELLTEARALLQACETADSAMPVPEGETFDAWFDDPIPAGELLNRQFGPFRLIRELAQGGMGVVFEAEQDEPKRRVALKVLKVGLNTEPARLRFEHEARILGNLSHPAIAALHGVGTHEAESGERVPYLVMELVRGALPITQYVVEKHLSSNDRLRLFLGVADAISAGHQRGVIHRDIKPDNVLVDANGRPKVIDFGIARVSAPDIERGQVTETGMVMGTLGYIAPEQLTEGGGGDDVRMDVYALGVILYEMLTGNPPLDLSGLDVMSAARATVERRHTAPTEYVPGMAQDIVLILNKALAKEPNGRYASVDAFARDVSLFLADEPINARPPSWTYQLRLFTKRHRVGVAASATVLLALAAATWFSIDAAAQEKEQRQAAQASERAAKAASDRAVGMLLGSQEMVQGLFREHYDELEKVPGTLPARLALVKRLERGTDTLRLHAQDDQRFLRMAGNMHLQVGRLNFSLGGGHLGRTNEAMASFVRGQKVFELLLARDDLSEAQRFEDRESLALALGDEADVWYFLGEAKKGTALSKRSLETLSALVDEQPHNLACRNGFASLTSRVALQVFRRGQEAEAIVLVQAALAKLPDHPEGDSNSVAAAMGNRGFLESLWGEILRTQGKLDEAQDHAEAGLKAFEENARVLPSDPRLSAKFAQSYGELGAIALSRGNPSVAEEHLTKAIEFGRKQVDQEPSDMQALQSLGVDVDRVAKLKMAQGDVNGAIAMQQQANEIGEKQVAAQPGAVAPQLGLRIGLNKLGGFANQSGNQALAKTSFERAYALAKQLVASHPEHPEVRLAWSEANDALGIVRFTQAGNVTGNDRRALLLEAKKLFERSVEITMAMTADDILPSTHKGWEAMVRNKIGIVTTQLANLDASAEKR